jgi:hypothetical protein
MDIQDLVQTYQQYLLEITNSHPTNERLKEMKNSDANEYFAYLAEGRSPKKWRKEDYERSCEYTLLDDHIATHLNENHIDELGGTWALFDQL